jgi:hypothetical protein
VAHISLVPIISVALPTLILGPSAAAATLMAAVIAAAVSVGTKRLERSNAAELQHCTAREAAYNAFLGACDRAWHFRIRSAVDEHFNGTRVHNRTRQRITSAVVRQCNGAVEELRYHSRDFGKAATSLDRLCTEAFESRQLSLATFESARLEVEELLREETGLRRTLAPAQRGKVWQQVKVALETRRVRRGITAHYLIMGPKSEIAPHVQAQVFGMEGEALVHMIRQLRTEWEDLQRGIELQESRAARWRSMGLWPE